MRYWLTLGLAMLTAKVAAQGLPGTDVWLARIEGGLPAAPVRISDGDGYNNQPHFSPEGKVIWYTREMPGAENPQTDIAAFDVASSATAMLTDSEESEYSPTPVPGGQAISVIRVEADQRQRLWSIDVDSGKAHVIFPDIEPVGYHAWFSPQDVAMFILGETFTLQTARLGKAGATLAASNIGRSLRVHPVSGEVLFVDKNPAPWRIAAWDPVTAGLRQVVALFPGSEDFTVDGDGNYWTGNGSKLYRFKPDDERWMLMADFSAQGVRHISRLAVHLQSGQIALVGE